MNLREPQTQKGLLAGIAVLGFAYAFHEYLYKPREIEIGELETQATRLEGYNAQAKAAAQGNRVATLEEESIGFARRLETFEELIPTTEQVPELLAQVATAALEADVDLLSFTPLPAEPASFYTEQFYEVEVRGEYHALGTFVTRVANLPRIVKPALVEVLGERVEPRNAGRSLTPPEPVTAVRAKLQLSTYVLPGGEARVVAADSAGGAPPAVPPAADQIGAPPEPAADEGAAPLPGGLAPGVAPAMRSADSAAAAAEAAGVGAAASDSVPAPAPLVGLPAAGSQAAAAQAPTAAPGLPTGIPAETVPDAGVVPPPPRVDPGALPVPGVRSGVMEDPSSPGALPPLGAEGGQP